MKIVQLVTRRQRRGAEVFAAQLGDALAIRGHEVVFLGLSPYEGEILVPTIAQAHDLTTRSNGRMSGARATELARVLKALQPDVVQANGSDTLKYSALARTFSRERWRLVYRNISIASEWLRYPGQRTWGKWLVRRVDHVAAVSSASRRDFLRTYNVSERQISTIPIGTPIPEILDPIGSRRHLARLAGIGENVPLLIHVGSFSPEKNHLWLLDAFARILSIQDDCQLVLVGEGSLRNEVAEMVSRKGLAPSVRFLGAQPNAAKLIAGADILLLPSRVEGIPGVILEAAAHGVPSVATEVGSISEAVENGRTGILVQLNDQSAFASAVVDLLSCRTKRLEMGLAAREFVRARFDISRVVDAFEELYLDLVGN